MEELKNIIKELQSYRTSIGLDVSDDKILDCAVRLYNTVKIENNKQGNKHFTSFDPQSKFFFSPASREQIFFLNKLGYNGDASKLTKFEARKLIGELKGGKNGRRV